MNEPRPFRPWLIQRCMLRANTSEITGFDSAFACDYMGSAEFEFGFLPASLRRIVTRTYTARPSGLSKDGKDLILVCHSDEQHAQVKAWLPGMATRTVRLKEHSYLKEVLNDDGDYRRDIVLWWDIENDWFLCLNQDVADLLMKALDALAKKWNTKGAK